jgi:hypothetical protein
LIFINNSLKLNIKEFLIFISELTLTPLPILLDNYAYILKDSKSAVVVDPGDPEPVIVSCR